MVAYMNAGASIRFFRQVFAHDGTVINRKQDGARLAR